MLLRALPVRDDSLELEQALQLKKVALSLGVL